MGLWVVWVERAGKAMPKEGVGTRVAQEAPGWGWETGTSSPPDAPDPS